MEGRPLEGPGSEARLQGLQQRFAHLHRRLDQAAARPPWPFALLCAATFLAVFVGGLLLFD